MPERLTFNENTYDVGDPFPAVCESRETFRNKLRFASYCRDSTSQPEKVLQRLRFLSIPITKNCPLKSIPGRMTTATCTKCANYAPFTARRDPPDRNTHGSAHTLRLTNPGDLEGCNHYTAVSYCWQQPRNFQDEEASTSRYRIIDGETTRTSRVPPNVIRRAIDFAMLKGHRLIWIDQECIDQDNFKDKTAHIQAMHLIFRRARDVVAILNCGLTNQLQLDILAINHYSQVERLFGHVNPDGWTPMGAPDPGIFEQIIQLAESLASDLWYTRACTYQEALLATRAIYLLIPCHPHPRAHSSQYTNSSQLVILDTNVVDAFRVIQNVLRLSSLEENSPLSADSSRLSSALKVLADPVPEWKNRPVKVALDCHRLSALDAIRPLIQRNVTSRVDLVALCGNLCNYSIRLDPNKVRRSGTELSVALYALALLNGDLSLLLGLRCSEFRQGFDTSLTPVSMHGIVNMPQRHDLINWTMESIFGCRVRPPMLVSDGLFIKGVLWRVKYFDMMAMRHKFESYRELIQRSSCDPSILKEIITTICDFLREERGLDLHQLANSFASHGERHLVTRLLSYDYLPVAISEDPVVSGHTLLPGIAYQYAHSIVNTQGEVDSCLPLAGAGIVNYLFTPYRVLIEEETREARPHFLLTWAIRNIRLTPSVNHIHVQSWPCKLRIDEGSFIGDARKLITSPFQNEQAYWLHGA